MIIKNFHILTACLALAACGGETSEQSSTVPTPPSSSPTTAETATLPPINCEDLSNSNFNNTNISSSVTVEAGAFTPPATGFPGFGPDYSGLPAFCRVIGSIHPTTDSNINFELWLPQNNWNGRFMQTGNGGVAGSVVHSSLVDPLQRGYAVANTDTGHTSGGDDIWGWAVGHPEKLTDFAWRAVHELTLTGKAITTARYGNDPEKSYFVGCSTGGRQGLLEAQRFPGDYDAIIAGAPANNWSPLMALSIVIQTNLAENGLGMNKLAMLKEAAIASCDAIDGVEDRVISNVNECGFDPASLQCQGTSTDQCLTENEVSAAQSMYAGVVDSSGQVWFPGTGPASEPLWAPYASPQFSLGTGFFKDILLEDSSWNPNDFNADDLMPMAVADSSELIAMNPDISAYLENDGKLIIYHGTTDGLISYGNSVNYVESMFDTLGEQALSDSVRFYLVPGMDHCAGGEGAHAVDWLSSMESWIEESTPPNTLDALHPAIPAGVLGGPSDAFTRPLCAWPDSASYNGSGDPADASNFSCNAP